MAGITLTHARFLLPYLRLFEINYRGRQTDRQADRLLGRKDEEGRDLARGGQSGMRSFGCESH